MIVLTERTTIIHHHILETTLHTEVTTMLVMLRAVIGTWTTMQHHLLLVNIGDLLRGRLVNHTRNSLLGAVEMTNTEESHPRLTETTVLITLTTNRSLRLPGTRLTGVTVVL
jgi:hypothetical protein